MKVVSQPAFRQPVIRHSSSEGDISSLLNKYPSTDAGIGLRSLAMGISESIIQSTGSMTKPTISSPSSVLLHKPRILVVDDEKNIRMTVQHSLMVANYEVDSASDGAEGLEKFHSGHYDLVLMDLRMPQMNGIEMLREIRENDKQTAAIVITAYLTIDTLLEAFALGVSDYIRKPFSPNDVREMVRRVLARGRLDTHTNNGTGTGGDSETDLELARKALAEQDLPLAMKFAKKTVEEDCNNPDCYAFLGIVEHLSGDTQAAERSFHEALLLDPQHQLSRDYLFWVQAHSKN